MFLHLEKNTSVRVREIIGIFDLDSASVSPVTRAFLRKKEKEKRLFTVSGEEVPKAFVLTGERDGEHIYMTTPASATLKGRLRASADR